MAESVFIAGMFVKYGKEFEELCERTGHTELAKEAVLMMYDATRDLPLEDKQVTTPCGVADCKVLAGRKLAVVPILRAGLGMVDGALRLVPAARVGHIGLYRNEETLEPVEYYCKLPGPQSKSSPFRFPCLPLALCLGLKCEIRKNVRLSMLSHKLDNPPVCCSPRSFHNLSGKFLLLPSMPLIRYLLLCVPSFRLLSVAFGYIIVTAVHLVNTFLLPPVTFLLIFVSYRAML